MRTLDIDTTEALFKLALERKDYTEVMRMVRYDVMSYGTVWCDLLYYASLFVGDG
jgi:hypothetical protein